MHKTNFFARVLEKPVYSSSLVSVGVLMALMGYVVGTFGGIGVGYAMSIFG